MTLLRRVIGDALRARRQGQHRTLRQVSTAANVSLGYLSEIERGQKEASSELLASICEALGSQLSEVLREASDSLARAERADGALVDGALDGALVDGALVDGALVDEQPGDRAVPAAVPEVPPARTRPPAPLTRALLVPGAPEPPPAPVTAGEVSVSVRRNGPLRTTLHAVRTRRAAEPAGQG